MDPRDVTEAIVAVAMAKVVSPAVEMETAKAVVAVVLVGTVATAAAVAATVCRDRQRHEAMAARVCAHHSSVVREG